MSRRVAVTGMAGISPLGNDWAGVRARLGEYRNAIARMPEWARLRRTQYAARRAGGASLHYPSATPRKPPGAWAGSL